MGAKADLNKLSHRHDQYTSHYIYQLITAQEQDKLGLDTF